MKRKLLVNLKVIIHPNQFLAKIPKSDFSFTNYKKSVFIWVIAMWVDCSKIKKKGKGDG